MYVCPAKPFPDSRHKIDKVQLLLLEMRFVLLNWMFFVVLIDWYLFCKKLKMRLLQQIL